MLARAGVVLTAPLLGLGVVYYALAAVVLVLNPRAGHGSSARWRTATGVGLLALAAVVAADAAGLAVDGDGLLWAVLLVGAGLSLFWGAGTGRELLVASDAQMKTLIGGALTLAGVGVILDRTGAFGVDAATLVGAVAVLLVLAFVFVPRALVAQRRGNQEKRRREREQERAEVGEMLHDSVLQTLALIQQPGRRRATCRALARRQERELRDWLLAPEARLPVDSLTKCRERAIGASDRGRSRCPMIETVIVGDRHSTPAVRGVAGAAVKGGDERGQATGTARISTCSSKSSATTATRSSATAGPGLTPPPIDADAARHPLRDHRAAGCGAPGATARRRHDTRRGQPRSVAPAGPL